MYSIQIRSTGARTSVKHHYYESGFMLFAALGIQECKKIKFTCYEYEDFPAPFHIKHIYIYIHILKLSGCLKCWYCVYTTTYSIQGNKSSMVTHCTNTVQVQTHRKCVAEVSKSDPTAGGVTVALLQIYNCAHFSDD